MADQSSSSKGEDLPADLTHRSSVSQNQDKKVSEAPREPKPESSKSAIESEEVKDKKHGLVNFVYKNYASFKTAIDDILKVKHEPRKVLSSFTIEGVAELIRENKASRIIIMCGAGISTSAGIPDFRSPGSGLYDNLAEYNLPDPLAVFDINFFRQNPKPFFAVARKLFPENLKPTPCHYFIRLLDQKGVLLRCFTQNIDSLESVAGLPAEKIVTAHGSYHTGKCLKCQKEYTFEWMRGILYDTNCMIFVCESCGGVVKPDIVFFNEKLPDRFFKCAATDFPSCDLLIIMGTSLVVQPFASMISEVGRYVPRLLINLTEAGNKGLFDGLLGFSTLRYGHDDNYRDVFWKGTCDDGAMKLADLLGWKEDLQRLIEHEWKALDAKKQTPAEVSET